MTLLFCLTHAALADDAPMLAFVEQASHDVAIRRELPLMTPVRAAMFSEEELRARIEQSLAEELSVAEVEAEQRSLVLLGLAPADIDLYDTYRDMLVEQVSGFYDPDDGQLFLIDRPNRSDPNALAADKLVVEHEIVHALQDQHYGLSTLDDMDLGDADLELALRSLVEGDASFFGVLGLAGDFIADISDLPLGTGGAALPDQVGSALSAAPQVISRSLVFPYTDGASFVQALYGVGGFAAVNQAYSRVPLSSEHILHPARYLADQPDLPVVLDLPDLADGRAGWTEIDRNTLGELGVLIWLDDVGGIDVIGQPLGWGGDRYVTLAHDGGHTLVWLTTWDTQGDAATFEERARRTVTEMQPTGRWRRDGRYGRTAWVGREGADVAVIIGARGRTATSLGAQVLDDVPRTVRSHAAVFNLPR